MSAEPLSGMMADVARELLGEPNERRSREADGVLRFGSQGSIEVNTSEGWFNDYEMSVRGGVLELIAHKAGISDHASAFRWLEAKGIKEPSNDTEQQPRTFYDYQDEAGKTLFRVERRGKSMVPPFLQHGPNGAGGFHSKKGCMQGVRRVVYRKPELDAADLSRIVFNCEGEKDADRLASLGLIATTNPGGAGKFLAEFAPSFADRKVIILEDCDEAGQKHAEDVKAKLEGVAAAVAILRLPGAPKSDVSDWLNMGGSAFELERLAAEALAGEQPQGLPLADMSEWDRPAPNREFAWGDWIPLRRATMLTGDGGVGKSLLVQMLMTCIALGRPFLGMDTYQGVALYVTAEDDLDELWRRQKAICAALGVSMQLLAGKLLLCSLCGETETSLANFDATGKMTPTARWRQVEATANNHGVRFAAFDTATDMMGGDHNDIHQVASFVNLLTGLAIARDGATMILHHPNKAGADWLGSIAWHNKVRSRLIIKRADGGDPDARVIENPKANYGPSGNQIEFRWHAGAFVRDEDLPESTASELRDIANANSENAAFMACLRQRASEGVQRAVGPSSGPNYAPSQFEGMAQAKGHKKPAFKRAMDRLYQIGFIETAEVERPGKSDKKTIIVEVPELSRTHSRTPPEHTSRTSPIGARTPPQTHYPLKGAYGAATEAAAPSLEDDEPDYLAGWGSKSERGE